jgi:23S rRNA G2445 N2-methylase RlmL
MVRKRERELSRMANEMVHGLFGIRMVRKQKKEISRMVNPMAGGCSGTMIVEYSMITLNNKRINNGIN